ncbi:transcriptional regulator, TraR/DksA family protein [Desulfobacter hydrogenophilus]|uniref:Transcriptional regulator, TraR/DksA family protein n=1 Tax=Desulfobacter hydrogenophilus TaxID=2291 RepID=A0A328FB87_9BACT|nr:TraR/DksA family transcriptional regulator [Desulfobacter hydrogenophilus]NDY73919.1 transcriptional regulator, TraR/DksA family protein [Desulfobacter hydrogenophilus]QBH12081.1 transcriptional regulator, TraR/DksA family protein [Desulfobacter hydrogenophilus]RAM00363.1 transcriptional regulator, TraR/DksA family protein [Desulfobacter hydrogenophilus]
MTQVSQVSSNKYSPLDNEPYMSDGQLAYFKGQLMQRKDELRNRISKSIKKIKTLEAAQADILDRINSYIDLELEVKSFKRHSDMIEQVDRALARIDDGSFGYCELTGDKIGLRRLEAIPFATMSIKALEAFEADQKKMFLPRQALYS